MLDKLREQSRSFLNVVIVAAIIVVFVIYFGPGASTCAGSSGPGFAAKVNGAVINVSDFKNSYGAAFNERKRLSGGSYTPEMAEQSGLREQVMDQLVSRELLVQQAARMGIEVGDGELHEKLQGRLEFQKDGEYDYATFKKVVTQYYGITEVQYVAQTRKEMLVQKVVAALQLGAMVSDDEVRAEFVRDNEKVNLAFVRFAPAQHKDEAPPPIASEAEQFAKDHADQVKEYFDKNSFRFNRPPRVIARQVLARVDEDAGPDKVEAARKRIEEARSEIDAGKDFADVAKRLSDDEATRARGGDLGEVSIGLRGKAFDDPVFATEAGKTTPVFRDRQGFHIVKVEQKFAETKKTLDDVRAEIAMDLMRDDRARDLAKKQAEAALGRLKAGKKLAELYPSSKKEGESSEFQFDLGTKKPEVAESGEFSPSGEFIPRIGVAPEMVTAAFSVDEKKQPYIDRVFEVNNAFYVVGIKSRSRAEMGQLEGKLAELRERARKKRADQDIDAYLKHLKDQSRIEKNASLLAPRLGTSAPDEG